LPQSDVLGFEKRQHTYRPAFTIVMRLPTHCPWTDRPWLQHQYRVHRHAHTVRGYRCLAYYRRERRRRMW